MHEGDRTQGLVTVQASYDLPNTETATALSVVGVVSQAAAEGTYADLANYLAMALYEALGGMGLDSLGAAHPGSPNAIWWDGRDSIGDRVANGTYIYVIDIEKDGTTVSYTGKAVCLE